MPRPPHDAVIPMSEFWRVLAFVVIGFGLVLALSWAIDAAVAHQALSATVTTARA